MSDINFITTSDLARKVKSVIKEIIQKYPIKKALDIPSGEGPLTQFLVDELKLNVIASDIDIKKWKFDKILVVQADMGSALPFPNESFDFVICLEGIKR